MRFNVPGNVEIWKEKILAVSRAFMFLPIPSFKGGTSDSSGFSTTEGTLISAHTVPHYGLQLHCSTSSVGADAKKHGMCHALKLVKLKLK